MYEIWGPLFFGSIQEFNTKFTPANDPPNIEIDFIDSKVSDHSGVEAISSLITKYENAGKSVKLKHLSPDCKAVLIKANPKFEKSIISAIDDPRYYVVTETMGIVE